VVDRFGWNKQKLVSDNDNGLRIKKKTIQFRMNNERNLLGFCSPQQEWLARFSCSQLSSAFVSFGWMTLLHEMSQAE
jgi:hypothetical protein